VGAVEMIIHNDDEWLGRGCTQFCSGWDSNKWSFHRCNCNELSHSCIE